MASRLEVLSVAAIALAVLVGGRFFLFSLAREHGVALAMLALVLVLQIAALRRNYARGGEGMRVRATRDVVFVAALLLALMVVVSPQRWSVGATIVALEFGLAMELLGRFSPASR